MERDLAAIQAKLDSLEQEADSIGTEHPEEAAIIRDRITQIQQIWEQLTQMVNVNVTFTNILDSKNKYFINLDLCSIFC